MVKIFLNFFFSLTAKKQTRFFFILYEAIAFDKTGAVKISEVDPAKKIRLDILMLSIPFCYIIQQLKNLNSYSYFLIFLKHPIIL